MAKSFFDSVTSPQSGPVALPLTEIVERLGIAFGLGLVVAVIFRLSFGRRKADAGSMSTTLVLLSVLIAMITLVIGDNAARAFTLGGALAIIRFRAVVDDTRDTAFVIFAVVVGMGAGAGSVKVILIGIPIVALVVLIAAAFIKFGSTLPVDRTLIVKLHPDRDPSLLRPALAVYASRTLLTGVETQKQGNGLDVTYLIKLRDPAAAVGLVTQLRAIEGVQAVEVKTK
ncbi:MAG TPA: DUF4956 domain-containing protein [Fimbriiglobus sp.]|jgi:hypothetical protein